MALGGIARAITGHKNGTTEHYKKGCHKMRHLKKRQKTDKIRHHKKTGRALILTSSYMHHAKKTKMDNRTLQKNALHKTAHLSAKKGTTH